MGPTRGPSGSCRPQMAPCWPHESCYQGMFGLTSFELVQPNVTLCYSYNRFSPRGIILYFWRSFRWLEAMGAAGISVMPLNYSNLHLDGFVQTWTISPVRWLIFVTKYELCQHSIQLHTSLDCICAPGSSSVICDLSNSIRHIYHARIWWAIWRLSYG